MRPGWVTYLGMDVKTSFQSDLYHFDEKCISNGLLIHLIQRLFTSNTGQILDGKKEIDHSALLVWNTFAIGNYDLKFIQQLHNNVYSLFFEAANGQRIAMAYESLKISLHVVGNQVSFPFVCLFGIFEFRKFTMNAISPIFVLQKGFCLRSIIPRQKAAVCNWSAFALDKWVIPVDRYDEYYFEVSFANSQSVFCGLVEQDQLLHGQVCIFD